MRHIASRTRSLPWHRSSVSSTPETVSSSLVLPYRTTCTSCGRCSTFCFQMSLATLRLSINGSPDKDRIKIQLSSNCTVFFVLSCCAVLRAMSKSHCCQRRKSTCTLACPTCRSSGTRRFWRRILMLLMVLVASASPRLVCSTLLCN